MFLPKRIRKWQDKFDFHFINQIVCVPRISIWAGLIFVLHNSHKIATSLQVISARKQFQVLCKGHKLITTGLPNVVSPECSPMEKVAEEQEEKLPKCKALGPNKEI